MFDPALSPDALLDAQLDAALDSYPLAPVPPGLMRRTLAKLPPRPRPRFRLEFVDLAVPMFLVIFALLTGWTLLWTLNFLSPHWMLELAPRLAFARQWLQFELMRLPVWLPALTIILGGLTLTGITLAFILLLERSLLSLRFRNE